MITSDDLLKAVEEVTATTDETDLSEFVDITPEALDEFLAQASTPLSEENATFMATGIIVALRAVKNNAENSD